ncbi:unnamed protein product [Rotaria sp. Silwood1]|nr:unnamed protein product [Rotaria sp. Silwood1]CAF4845932.1 unnamed protein product [Rotaria sp. Silwood1]
MNGPAVKHWCMRFESKHKIFKQLAIKSNNYKNILYTLSKRHQLHQCLLLSSTNYYNIINEGYSSQEKHLLTLPTDIRKLLSENIENIDHTKTIMEYHRLQFDHVMFIKGEDIDGETLFNLPQSMVYEIIKPMKERVRFLAEHRALFHNAFLNNSDEDFSNNYLEHSPHNNSQQLMKQHDLNQVNTMSTITFSNNEQSDSLDSISSENSEVINEEIVISPKSHEEKENGEDITEITFPNIYTIPDLPKKIQQYIDKGENDWIESLKAKFKRERRPLQQTSEQVQRMKLKYGGSTGRPITSNDHEIAPRREVPLAFWNKIDLIDDDEDLNASIEFMRNELALENNNLDRVRVAWKKTLVARRTFIQSHTTKEVLQEYPGYRIALLVFDEIQYLCNVDVESNWKSVLPKLLVSIPDNSGFEPLDPRPTIRITTDSLFIYLDFDLITETKSIDQALCIIISLYVIFELQFGSHNRAVHLLYGVLLQEPAILTKPLRSLLKQWDFHIEKKDRKINTQIATITSTNNNKRTTDNFQEAEDDQGVGQIDSGYQENSTENTDTYIAIHDITQNLTINNTYGATDELSNKSARQIPSTNSSPSSIDSPLAIQIVTPEEKETSLTVPISIKNSECRLNATPSIPLKSSDLSSSNKQELSFLSRKRRANPENTIVSRLKRSKTKKY